MEWRAEEEEVRGGGEELRGGEREELEDRRKRGVKVRK